MASGGVVALEPGSKTEEKTSVNGGNQQDRYQGRNQLRKGGRVIAAGS